MPITVTPAPGARYSITDVADLLDGIFTGRIVDSDSSGAVIEVRTPRGTVVAVVEGRDLSLNGGTLDTIDVSLGGRPLGTISDLDLSVRAVARALEAESNGNRSALENLLLSRDWDYTGTGARDDNGGTVGDGVPFNFRGDDRIDGAGGRDRLFGGMGNDTLFGGDGNDDVAGEAGRDRLSGDAGRDALAGGTGNDILTGGEGADLFIMFRGDGRDRVTDYTDGEDTLGVEADGLSALAVRQVGDDTVIRGEGWTLRLDDVAARDLTAADFEFV